MDAARLKHICTAKLLHLVFKLVNASQPLVDIQGGLSFTVPSQMPQFTPLNVVCVCVCPGLQCVPSLQHSCLIKYVKAIIFHFWTPLHSLCLLFGKTAKFMQKHLMSSEVK